MSCAPTVSATRKGMEEKGELIKSISSIGLDGKERPRQVERKAPEPELPLASAVAVGKATAAQVLARVEPAKLHGGERQGSGRKAEQDNQVDNINLIDSKTKGGTGADYLAARIKRDHPAIAAGIAAGEYPSIRAAAIAAGIVKVPSALETLQRAWKKASSEEQRQFLEWISNT